MNEITVLVKPIFVKPHYIEELGCDGLTASEIANSLNIDADAVRKKLRGDFIHRMKSLNLLERRMKNINGVEYDEFLLSTDASRFFVARHESDLGDGYLIYLLGIEKTYEKLKEENALLKTKLLGQKDQTLLLAEQSTLKDKLKEAEAKIEVLTAETKGVIHMYSTFYNTIMRKIKLQAKMLFSWGGPKAMELLICNKMMDRFNIELLGDLRVIDYEICLHWITRFEQDSLGGDFKAKRTAREFYEGIREKPTHF